MILYISPAYRISSNSFVSSAPLIITVINSISVIMKSDDKQFLTGILIDISIRQHTKKYTDNAVYKYYKTYIKSIRALQKPSHRRSSDQFFVTDTDGVNFLQITQTYHVIIMQLSRLFYSIRYSERSHTKPACKLL